MNLWPCSGRENAGLGWADDGDLRRFIDLNGDGDFLGDGDGLAFLGLQYQGCAWGENGLSAPGARVFINGGEGSRSEHRARELDAREIGVRLDGNLQAGSGLCDERVFLEIQIGRGLASVRGRGEDGLDAGEGGRSLRRDVEPFARIGIAGAEAVFQRGGQSWHLPGEGFLAAACDFTERYGLVWPVRGIHFQKDLVAFETLDFAGEEDALAGKNRGLAWGDFDDFCEGREFDLAEGIHGAPEGDEPRFAVEGSRRCEHEGQAQESDEAPLVGAAVLKFAEVEFFQIGEAIFDVGILEAIIRGLA